MNITQCRPGSEEFEEAIRGRVLCERINEVMAKPGTKAHDEYLAYVRESWLEEPVTHKGDQFRYSDDRIAAIGNALRFYRDRDECQIKAGLVFLSEDEFPLAAAPHGIEADKDGQPLAVLQIHVRASRETWQQAVDRGPDNNQLRVSWAQIAFTGASFALQIDWFENAHERLLHDHLVEPDRIRGAQLMGELQMFAAKSRLQAVEQMRAAG